MLIPVNFLYKPADTVRAFLQAAVNCHSLQEMRFKETLILWNYLLLLVLYLYGRAEEDFFIYAGTNTAGLFAALL